MDTPRPWPAARARRARARENPFDHGPTRRDALLRRECATDHRRRFSRGSVTSARVEADENLKKCADLNGSARMQVFFVWSARNGPSRVSSFQFFGRAQPGQRLPRLLLSTRHEFRIASARDRCICARKKTCGERGRRRHASSAHKPF